MLNGYKNSCANYILILVLMPKILMTFSRWNLLKV